MNAILAASIAAIAAATAPALAEGRGSVILQADAGIFDFRIILRGDAPGRDHDRRNRVWNDDDDDDDDGRRRRGSDDDDDDDGDDDDD